MLATVAAALAACGGGSFEPDVSYRMIGLSPAVDGACADAPEPSAPDLAGAVAVRLTYLDAGTTTLRCDARLELGTTGQVIAVPEATRPVDLVVEYVDATGGVVGRGATGGIDLSAGGEVTVQVAPSEQFACAPDRGTAARAFHSATLLPNGELLLLGGIAGPGGVPAIDPTAGFFLQSRVEIYDPATGLTRQVPSTDLVPRAFHQAYVVGQGNGVVQIAVIGGLTVTGDPATTPVAVVGASYRIEPAPNAIGASGQLLTYDPEDSTLAVSPMANDATPRAFGALSRPGEASLAYVGGGDPAASGNPARTSADRIDTATGDVDGTIATRRARIGATVTVFAPGQLIVWGGDVTTNDGTGTAELGELLTGWDSTPGSAPLTLDGTSETGPPRAFHAAALAGDGTVILVGGYRMDTDATLAPVSSVMQRLTNPGSGTVAQTLLLGDVVTAVGYPAAVTVGDGDVVAAGGNPDAAVVGDCDIAQAGLLCATGQGLRYDRAAGTADTTGELGIARYGLVLTLLADGTVVASGGIAPSGASLVAIPDLELYEPRGTADDPLAPTIVREPGEIARDVDGDPIAPCEIIVGPDAGT